MPKTYQNEVQLGPEREEDSYAFLRAVSMECGFLQDAKELKLAEFSPSILRGAVYARDRAIDTFNRWMNEAVLKFWFLAYQRFSAEEDTLTEKGLFIQAGENMLKAHRCQSVLAILEKRPIWIHGPNGRMLTLREVEEVALHCILFPKDDEGRDVVEEDEYSSDFKKLTVEAVPTLQFFDEPF